MKTIWITVMCVMLLHAVHSQTIVPVDVMHAGNNGFCTITNTTIDIGSINDLFDGNASTLCRSANINPFECTLIFSSPVTFHSCSVLLTAGSNSWTLEVANSESELTGKWGSYQKLYSDRFTDENQLDSVSLNSVSVKVIKLSARRLTGDNYVHLFSWNLYAYSTPNAIMFNKSFPDTTWVGATFKPMVTLSSTISSTPFPLDSSKLSFSSSNTGIVSIVNGNTVNPVAPGTATITANYDGITVQHNLTVKEDKFRNDLDVCYIKRLPEIPYVENSADPGREGWPAVGQQITWRAYSKNWSPDTLRNVAYQWLWNGDVLRTGTIPMIPPYSYTHVDLDTTWSFDRKELTFVIDPANLYPELSERNNSLAIYTDALSIHFYVEDMTYRYFHDHQANLKVGTNSWEDWAQILQIQRWNQMFANAIYPETPNGVFDRVRLDSVYIVPDGALPLNGGMPTNHPDLQNKLCDLQWGFTAEGVKGTAYRNDSTAKDDNMFFYEGSLIHELGHARYLIDTYGLDLNDGYNHDKIKIMDNGQYIGGTDWMPFNAWDNVHYSLEHGLMSSNYTVVDRYSTMALNHIFHHRALCGNCNSPCNIGVYLNDIPQENRLTVIDQYGNIVPGATVSIYQAEPYNEWYGKTFDNTPELVFTTDANGQTLLGHCPFSSTGSITHGYGFSNALAILKAEKNGARGYTVMEVTQFNIQYWKGNAGMGEYVVQINFTTSPFNFKITTPGDGNLFKQGDLVNIAAESTSSNITKVEFYCNTNLISTDYSAPYEAVWNSDTASNGYVMIKALAYNDQGNTALSQREINVIVRENKPSPLIQKIAIEKGWNLISMNLQPIDSSVESVFSNIDIAEIKSNDGYWRKGQNTAFNSLHSLSAGEGYILKSNVSDTLIVAGVVRKTGNVIATSIGWKLLGVSYQNKTPFTRDYNQTNTLVIKNFEGFWIPDGTTNSIEYFEPGKAYFWKR